MPSCRTAVTLTAMLIIGLTGHQVLAHSGATGVIKERMDMMKDMGKAMKSIAGMFKGEVAYDAAALQQAAGVIEDHAGKLPEQFPEGTNHDPSEALPAVWQRPDDFRKLSEQLAAYAGALKAAAGNVSTLAEAREMMGRGSGAMTTSGEMGENHMVGGGMPDPEHLASMPPQMAFKQVIQSCKGCHQDFRQEQK